MAKNPGDALRRDDQPAGIPPDQDIVAAIPDTFTEEQMEMEEQALAISGEGDSPTSDDRVATVAHVEDMPNMSPEGSKPASLEDILRREREGNKG